MEIQGEGIIGRMGGKYLLKTTIMKYLPDNYQDMIYVEPFVGGGSVFFKKEPSKIEVINDLDKNVMTVYKGFKKYDNEKIKDDVNGHYSKEEFKTLKDYKPKGDYEKFIKQFILFRTSLYGQCKTFSGRGNINMRENYNDRLKHVKMYNTDYKNLIKKYDSKNTLFYLDPPYEGSSEEHYEHHAFDYDELERILSHIKGLFLLSINDSPNIRKLFKNFDIIPVKTKYANPNDWSKPKIKTELLIKNY